jgi:hypothetical protein
MYKIIGADGKEYGPVSAEVLRQWIAEGRVNPQTRVLPENATEWKPLSDLPEFGLSATAPAPVLPGPIIPGVITAPVQRKTNPLATTGLVLGIISITFGLCCCSGFPFSVAGAICSGIALAQLKDNPNQEGRGIAIAGLIISIAAVLLGVLLVVLYGFVSSMPDVMRRMQRL